MPRPLETQMAGQKSGENHKVMNKSLARIHLGLAIFYGLIAVLLIAVHLASNKASLGGVLILLAIFGTLPLLHALALKGVRQGRGWGRTLSRVLGVLLLFAIPIGTILGAFVLMRTGKTDWEHAAS
jgi:heme/copper-type cytochrome/quinol oxidase subunit 4